MFKDLYTNPLAKSEEVKAERVIGMLYDEYMSHIDKMPEEYIERIELGEPKEVIVCDYIAGMTDNYAEERAKELFIPRAWQH